MVTSKQKIRTFLTFSGKAEEAMNLYVSLFDQSEVVSIQRYGPNGQGVEGSVMYAIFVLDGQQFMCSDSPVTHDWGFTPAVSLYVACSSEGEISRIYERLSESGQVLMPLQAYPFSEKFAWVADRYGVSWQLGLERP